MRVHACFALVICLGESQITNAQGTAGYPGVFDTSQVLHLNVTLDSLDFETIRSDETFQIEAPAQFWADGEAPLNIVIRRKSADSINGKVSYKIDINKIIDGQKWNDLNKLSLENGDDQDVVSEGLAWYMHRVAAGTITSYSPSMAAWATLTINGEDQGIYVNVEQVDKQYLKNRALWVVGDSWLFYQDDLGMSEYKEGPTQISPTMESLNFAPFAEGSNSPPAPSGAQLRTLLNDKINMDAMLMLGAVNAFSSNPDELFNHAKNFFWADFAAGTSLGNSNGKRMYFPWDLDSALQSTMSNIYGQGQEAYQQLILNDPEFRHQFNLIMLSLLNGPLSVQSLTTFINDMEPILTPYLEADPNNQIGADVAGHFDSLRDWVAARHANVYQQVIADIGSVPILGDFNGDGAVNAADYVRWRKNGGTQTGYNDWRAHFGETTGSGVATGSVDNTSVPEPCSSLIALISAALCALARSGAGRSGC